MTLASETYRNQYSGNAVTVEFAIDFYFLDDAHIRAVLYNSTTEVETELALTTNFTLVGEGVPAGGTLTMLVAPASTETLTIIRDVPLTQETDYVENTTFPAESHEAALDKLTMGVQQLQEQNDRTVKIAVSQTESVDLPIFIADRAIKVDTAGTGLEMSTYDPDEAQTDSAASAAAAGLSETAAEAAQTAAEAAAASNSYVKTMTANETPAFVGGHSTINQLDPGGADRTFNPTASFPAGYEMVIINTGEEVITFDSAVLGQSVGSGQKISFYYNGTIWT